MPCKRKLNHGSLQRRITSPGECQLARARLRQAAFRQSRIASGGRKVIASSRVGGYVATCGRGGERSGRKLISGHGTVPGRVVSKASAEPNKTTEVHW